MYANSIVFIIILKSIVYSIYVCETHFGVLSVLEERVAFVQNEVSTAARDI